MRSTIDKRLSAIEKRVLVRLSPIELTLCENERFLQMVSRIGMDIEAMKRSGKVLGSLPRDLLLRIVARLNLMAERQPVEA